MKRGAPHGGGETDDGTARADRYIGGRVNFFIMYTHRPDDTQIHNTTLTSNFISRRKNKLKSLSITEETTH